MNAEHGLRTTMRSLRQRFAAVTEGHALLALAAVLVITALHYATAPHHGPYHDLYRRLYYVPVIYGAVRYGLMGGALLSVSAGLMYLPHLIDLLVAQPDRRVDNVAGLALLLVVGILTGALVDALGRRERLAAIGGQVSRLVDDVRSPMSTISDTAILMAQPHVDRELRREMAGMIGQTAERLAAMGAEILQYARDREFLRSDDCSLNDLVRDVVGLYRQNLQAVGVEVRLRLGGDAVVRADRNRLRRALLNLLENAKEAMPKGGRLTLITEVIGREARIRVRDTGCGIADEIAGELFEPFVTRGKRWGTGLGLAIVKEIVNAHGGEVTGENSAGQGATFTISLPLPTRWAAAS